MLVTFPKIFSVGSPEVLNTLFLGGVEVTEKLDGSQCGFGLDSDGKLCIRSKGSLIINADVVVREPDKLFSAAVEHIKSIKHLLQPETNYYGEVISTNKHNTLTYRAVPRNHIVLYGIQSKGLWVDDHEILVKEADKLGLDAVALIFSGVIVSRSQLDDFLKQESVYGGTNIEGVVVKNYNQLAHSAFSSDCFGKYVSEKFKEMNHKAWSDKPSRQEDFYASFQNNKALWDKTIQHLRDDGLLTHTPKDIGSIIEACLKDFEEEQSACIKEQLYKLYIKQIKGFVVKGLPQHYKEVLAQASFVEEPADV